MQAGFLDVHIEKKTMVDYMELEIETRSYFTGLAVFVWAIIIIQIAVFGLDFFTSKANAGKKSSS